MAQRLGLPEQTLLTANPQLAQSGRITAGQEIRLPQSGATAQAAQAGPHLPSSPAELPPEIRQPVSGSGDPVQKAIIQGRLKDLKPDLYGDLPAVQAFGSFEKLAHEASEEKKWTKSGVNDKIWEFRDHSNRFMVDTNPGD
ncbi:MAG: hypothetical protein HYR60_33860, partial [Acidobacteria bacterium]|nr:hypothetical protein [Acidobacteriota bacterium]